MGFPEELKKLNQWVCWRLTPDKDGGKPRKVPIDPKTGKAAASNKPETWTDYDTAADALERYGYTGLGFMFTKECGVVGVDIDHCYDPEKQQFNEIAASILAKQPTYAEFSPSGDGCHLWFKGTKPPGSSKNSETGVEMYDSVRYFTVTGKQLEGAPDTLSEGTEALAWIHETSLAKKKPAKGKGKKKKKAASSVALSDEEVLEKAQTSGDGETFSLLWQGNWKDAYPSQSEADMALCLKLAFWTGKDRVQMDRLFRQSGLYRQKWDERHRADGTTYGEETLDKAIEATENVYSPNADTPIFEHEGKYFRIKGENIYPVTNFVFRPVEMIRSDEETQLTADLVTVRGETYRLTFMTTDFANQQKFKNLLNKNTIALSYFGTDGDLELLKGHLSDQDWTLRTGVKAMGVYEHQGRLVFVAPDGAIQAGGTLVEDIVQLEKYRSIQSGILACDPLGREKLVDLGKSLLSYNEPAKTISILAWAAGCFLKSHLRKCGIKYPHLFLIGEAGSGKSTTLELVILPIFSSTKVTAATQITAFTLMKESASSNLIPLPLDEFKPSKMDRLKLNVLYNHFRDAYDGHEGVRGRADQSVVTYELLAPMVVAGEESADETAIRERSIELLFTKKNLKNTEHRKAFNHITRNADALGDLGRSLLNTALKLQPLQCAAWHKEGMDKFAKELPSRVVNNLSCCHAGLKLMQALCSEYRLAWTDVFPFSFDTCVRYLEHAAKDYLLDGGMHNQSVVEQTFEVMARMRLDPRADYCISEDGTKLYLRLSHVYDLYTKFRKDYAIVGEVLPYAQFKKQLQHSDLLLEANVQKKIGSDNRKCWVVDFVALQERCDVSGFFITEVEPL